MNRPTSQSARSASLRIVPSPAAGDSRDALVTRAASGNVEAWSELYQEFHPRIFRHLRFLSGDSAVAEDLTQECFATAMVALKDFSGRSSFSTWLHGVAINVFRRHRRWQKNTSKAHERLEQVAARKAPPASHDPDRRNLQKARAQALYAVLDQLPDNLREVFILRDLEGRSEREIAEELAISRGNVAVRATRARARIRKELEKLGWLSKRGGSS